MKGSILAAFVTIASLTACGRTEVAVQPPASRLAAQAITSLSFGPGQVCPAFGLDVTISSPEPKEFKNGHVLFAGRGSAVLFTNQATGKKFQLKSDGSVIITTVDGNGVTTVRAEGHNIIFLFPTDITKGPSTTLYVGRVVFTADQLNNFEIISSTGRTVDICAQVA